MTNTHSQSQSKAASDSSRASLRAGLLQRKCACGNHTIAGGECDECGKQNLSLQRASRNSERATRNSEVETRNLGGVPPIVPEVLNSSGQALDASTRAFFEPRFRHDFSRVRVHFDARAAESARAMNAHAYTVASEVVFSAGQYAPRTSVGMKLLAHELAHVVQQQGAPTVSNPNQLSVSGQSFDSLEIAAEAAANQIFRVTALTGLGGGRLSLQRQAVPEPEESPGRRGQPQPYREAMESMARDRISGAGTGQQSVAADRTRTEPGMTGSHGRPYTVYQTEVRVGGSMAWRNNNPGNLRYRTSAIARTRGAISIDRRGFAIFPSEAAGWDALTAFLRSAAGRSRTIRSVMEAYAPSFENDTEAYLNFIGRTGLDPNSQLTLAQVETLARAIRRFEGWESGQIFTCDSSSGAEWVRPLLGC